MPPEAALLRCLNREQRTAVECLLVSFDQQWRPDRLRASVVELREIDDAARFPAFVELIKIDIEKHWQSGMEVTIEHYLNNYPELGTTDKVPPDLVCAEYEARRQRYPDASIEQYSERFPEQIAHVRVLLESPPSAVEPTAKMPQISERTGDSIGKYKLMEQIGEGGMGVVYVAEQERPMRRRVALKVIKPGMDSREVIARFEAERQALALMDHPNIAKVHDAGTTESGRPYFVMELVRGIPITEYCDLHRFNARNRLDLFVHVCQAVQHAHQKGIIHRDIKPSNVLITEHDGTPVVKVIDFGVAKAINQQLTERTIYTRHQQMVGTPMSLRMNNALSLKRDQLQRFA